MFDIARWSIERPLYPWIIVFCCIAAGWYGINTVGRLEDPVFDFGMAVVVTPYPGASAEEVEHEVTDVIESAIQELPYLEILTSQSVPGRSEIRLQVYPQYMGDRLPQVWDEMRRRVGEARYRLPPGAGPVIVEDDFGDVFGILYAVKAAGYSPAQTRDIANSLVRHLKLVHGVARVGITGLPEEAIFVELDRERLARMGLPVEQIFASISVENQVLGAGSISVADRRIRIRPPPSFESVQAVADLLDGSPGELFITMAKEGSTIGGLMDSLGTAISVALQYGVPVESLVTKFAHQRFEPMGMTANSDIPFAKSLVDYIFRWLGMQFIDGYRERNAPVRAARAAAETAPADSRTTQEERAWNQSRTDRTLASPAAPGASKNPSPSSSTRTAPASETAAAPSHARVIVSEQFAEIVETIEGDRKQKTTIVGASVSSLDQSNANLMGDAPACDVCGSITVRNGSCYRCLNCGQSMGCS